MAEEEKGKWRKLANMYEQAKDFKKAGLAYLEIADLDKTKAMINGCKTVRPNCENDLREESEIMAKALERNIRMPQK